ncbi:unnamed protein product [Anisakis simplex]|uniref:Protein phosphatase Slingshot (inferred by orthology to a D. melanogaster protein) n=1 Tax=Anisakis simplex TaxID=6269 RepID=A0A0M3J1M1_ANISI|nr:unnamed protein product [Anisakis simplex]
MSLVTVQRSPTPSEDADLDETDVDISECDSSSPRRCRSVTSSECFFYVKGTAVILLNHDRTNTVPTSTNDEIEEHLQSMLRIISPQHTLTMAVRLQTTSSLTASVNNEFDECCSFPCSTSSYSSLVSLSQDHARYLAVVTSSFRPASCSLNRNDDCNSADKDLSFSIRECVLLGLDCITNDEKATIGVVIPIHASTHIRLDGDGGISIDFDQSYHHLFRPVSVQAMWTMFQCLHKELREAQNAITSPSQTARSDERMTDYYLKNISSQDAIRNEWLVVWPFLFS